MVKEKKSHTVKNVVKEKQISQSASLPRPPQKNTYSCTVLPASTVLLLLVYIRYITKDGSGGLNYFSNNKNYSGV